MKKVGIVVIGRNEGLRLAGSLSSVLKQGAPFVYVDSNSSDNSIEIARELGAEIVTLNKKLSPTAARARNAGVKHLCQKYPDLEYVQFIDGDCELVPGWLEAAQKELDNRSEVALVAGRRRERNPQTSIYNRLCDLEWDTAVGEMKRCGGDMMVRIQAFTQAGGFNPAVIAAEDNELCVRIRLNGWKAMRLPNEMTVHDANIVRFSQWWNRTKRTGYGFAHGMFLHGNPPEKHFVRECIRAFVWGLLVPLTILLASLWTNGIALILFFLYPLLVYKIYQQGRTRGWAHEDVLWYSIFTVVSKFPELVGIIGFYFNLLLGRTLRLVEYKGPAT